LDNIKTCLTIAGSDSSGGAGIQADLKTFSAFGVYGMSAITAVTAQNTQGVTQIEVLSPKIVRAQIDAVFEDIRPDAVKIGMLANAEICTQVANALKQYRPEFVVLDPVMISTSGSPLLDKNAISTMINRLFPLVTLITPNTMELMALYNFVMSEQNETASTESLTELKEAPAILAKGGHLQADTALDLLLSEQGEDRFHSPRINTANNHGTGCTLAAAIAANLAGGKTLEESCAQAKQYLTNALSAGLDLGEGSGPLWHGI